MPDHVLIGSLIPTAGNASVHDRFKKVHNVTIPETQPGAAYPMGKPNPHQQQRITAVQQISSAGVEQQAQMKDSVIKGLNGQTVASPFTNQVVSNGPKVVIDRASQVDSAMKELAFNGKPLTQIVTDLPSAVSDPLMQNLNNYKAVVDSMPDEAAHPLMIQGQPVIGLNQNELARSAVFSSSEQRSLQSNVK